MSAYIKLATLEYPRHEGDIRLEHPEIPASQTGLAFPCPDTYAFVQPVNTPKFNPQTQVSFQLAPVNSNGVWSMFWAVRDLTQDELDARKAP